MAVASQECTLNLPEAAGISPNAGMRTWPDPEHLWQAAKNLEDDESARPSRTITPTMGDSEFSIKPLRSLAQSPVARPDCLSKNETLSLSPSPS